VRRGGRRGDAPKGGINLGEHGEAGSCVRYGRIKRERGEKKCENQGAGRSGGGTRE